jgi:hypothetical protein
VLKSAHPRSLGRGAARTWDKFIGPGGKYEIEDEVDRISLPALTILSVRNDMGVDIK